jgi:hypothetical protein
LFAEIWTAWCQLAEQQLLVSLAGRAAAACLPGCRSSDLLLLPLLDLLLLPLVVTLLLPLVVTLLLLLLLLLLPVLLLLACPQVPTCCRCDRGARH